MSAAIKNIEEYRITVNYDGELIIARGKSRFDTKWKNDQIPWSILLVRLSDSQRTSETHDEFMKYSKSQQDDIKDIGGFVGGHLNSGHRKADTVRARQMLTLDLDNGTQELMDELTTADYGCAMCIYSTHKHTPKKPRLRLIIPLDREVSPEEYEAIARKFADRIGMDYFDDSTFQPSRLMYWPSHSKDVKPFFRYVDKPFLKADDILARYPGDWKDISYWPYSSRVTEPQIKHGKKQEDPTQKRGTIGAFCRTYTIPEAIETFIPDVYEQTDKADRYTYTKGSTAAGLVIYEDGLFAYSNHSTDPASGQLCNAFDLVRIHKFGELDTDPRSGVKASTNRMLEFAASDPKTQETIDGERQGEVENDFAKSPDWKKKLERAPKTTEILKTPRNAKLILWHDEKIQGIRINRLSNVIEIEGSVPWDTADKIWRNADDAQLQMYINDEYGVDFPERIFRMAFSKVVDDRGYNPLQNYIKSLPEWDGMPRIDTLLIDYLGAADTEYVRTVTRKTLVGAIMRALKPGSKFDTVLVLDGPQGIGKSTLLETLCPDESYYSSSLSLSDTRDKTAAELLQGKWIVEIAELQGMRKADIDNMKNFISTRIDDYRPAYARDVEHRKRTAIICATTNSKTGFLRDTTGNRRWWPVNVLSGVPEHIRETIPLERDQIWAEAKKMYLDGEKPYLDLRMEKEAEKAQTAALEYDERTGEIEKYLSTRLPENWYEMSTDQRVRFFQGPFDELNPRVVIPEDEGIERTEVCTKEIFTECFGRRKESWKRADSYDISSVMDRIPGWRMNPKDESRKAGYGHQRVYRKIHKS